MDFCCKLQIWLKILQVLSGVDKDSETTGYMEAQKLVCWPEWSAVSLFAQGRAPGFFIEIA